MVGPARARNNRPAAPAGAGKRFCAAHVHVTASAMGPKTLLHVWPSFVTGGAQVRFATIANHFGRRWRHAIIAMDGNLAARARLDPGLDLLFPDFAPPPGGGTLGTVRAIRAVLRRLRPDALFTGNWGTIEWAIANRLGSVRHVHVEDGFGPEERLRQIPRRVWTRRLMLAGRTVVVPSATLRRIAVETWRLDPAQVLYLPNGVDLDRFAPAPAGPAPAGHEPVLGTAAALRSEKNIDRLLRAFARAAEGRPGRLAIAGDGPEAAALRAEAAALGIAGRVEWAGHLADAAPFLRGLDGFVLSSDTEQMPLSLLEAMATGLPVASTDVGDVATMLPPAQRPLVVAAEDSALAGAMARLLTEPPLRATLGAANRARAVESFDQRCMLERWADLYDGR